MKKFRIWDKAGQRMIYPNHENQTHYILTLNGEFHDLQTGVGGRETVVMQCTGMRDSLGNEIYEKDIVRAGNDQLYMCEYSDEEAAYVLNYNYGTKQFIYLSDFDSLKVVGNAFEKHEYI